MNDVHPALAAAAAFALAAGALILASELASRPPAATPPKASYAFPAATDDPPARPADAIDLAAGW